MTPSKKLPLDRTERGDRAPWDVPRKRAYHMAALWALDGSGNVSALCYAKPHPIDMTKRQSWTIRPEAVTCPKCKKLLGRKP